MWNGDPPEREDDLPGITDAELEDLYRAANLERAPGRGLSPNKRTVLRVLGVRAAASLARSTEVVVGEVASGMTQSLATLVVLRVGRLILPEKQCVPSSAEKLLSLLYSPERLPEKLGDFEEGFHLLATRHGFRHARRWYRWQVALAAAHQVGAGIRWLAETLGKVWGEKG